MNALTTQNGTGITATLAEKASNEVRALTLCEVDEVSGGGHMLFAITGILLVGMVCLDYGEELTAASEKLAEWIRG